MERLASIFRLLLDVSEDMFKTAMSKMNVDVKRMPLGQLSNAQVCFHEGPTSQSARALDPYAYAKRNGSIHETPERVPCRGSRLAAYETRVVKRPAVDNPTLPWWGGKKVGKWTAGLGGWERV